MGIDSIINFEVESNLDFATMSTSSIITTLIIALIFIIANWKIFTKAGKPGWASIVPIYNIIVFFQIVKRPIWWIILMFIPFVNIVISIIVMLDLLKVFGKSGALWVIGIIFFNPIATLMLAFGDAEYNESAL